MKEKVTELWFIIILSVKESFGILVTKLYGKRK